jgi:hypothetical protein
LRLRNTAARFRTKTPQFLAQTYHFAPEIRGLVKTSKVQKSILVVLLLAISGALFAQSKTERSTPDWQTTFQSRLALYGHRNWIVVADSAFPVYSQPGIETVAADGDLGSVLSYVMRAISSSKHVRGTVLLDKELEFVAEADYPGVTALRKKINAAAVNNATSIPHAEVLSKLDDAGKTFRILFIKTTTTIPYTSVYIRLDCGYMSDQIDRKIKSAMQGKGQ